jgi:hypothetical protein
MSIHNVDFVATLIDRLFIDHYSQTVVTKVSTNILDVPTTIRSVRPSLAAPPPPQIAPDL